MAASILQHLNNWAAFPATVTLPSVTAGSTIVAIIFRFGSAVSTSDISDGVNTYTQLRQGSELEVTQNFIGLFEAHNVAGGNTTLTSAAGDMLEAIEIGGVTSNPVDVHNIATGISVTPSVTVVTTVNNDLMIGAFTDDAASSVTIAANTGAGYTLLDSELDSSVHDRGGIESKNDVGAFGSNAVSFTIGASKGWCCIGASFKPFVASGSPTYGTPRGLMGVGT